MELGVKCRYPAQQALANILQCPAVDHLSRAVSNHTATTLCLHPITAKRTENSQALTETLEEKEGFNEQRLDSPLQLIELESSGGLLLLGDLN